MRNLTTVRQTITINATAAKVWSMFIDAQFTRQMGGEYVSEWTVGSSLGWKGLNGQMLTSGTILKIEKERILQHNLFYPGENNEVMATITYELYEKGGKTTVAILEEFMRPITKDEQSDAEAGWQTALTMVKGLLEK
jgi:uncharacterized protein YndB with AHSA1/START domain